MTADAGFDASAAGPAGVQSGSRRRWSGLFVVASAQLVAILDETIVNIALPSAQKSLRMADADRQWVITAYTLAFGSLLLFGGRLADRFGPKRTFAVGLTGFAIASAVGGIPAAQACWGSRCSPHTSCRSSWATARSGPVWHSCPWCSSRCSAPPRSPPGCCPTCRPAG
ncbi:MFS transporter [Streptomyces sp. NPDC058221]|uniref:MFS transporter n=1 Tax=Streptomyces sp. NPDC058221 TaxID=3346388 RepID=UPI0036E050B7